MSEAAKQEFIREQQLERARSEPADNLPALTPVQLIQIAVQRGDDLERVTQLMAIEHEWKADRAKEAFNIAMADFKKVALTVTKDKVNTQYESRYTTLGNLVNTVNSAMAPFGLNASWEIDQTNGIKVTCVLTHTLGHSKSVSLSGPPDNSGSKNPLQQIKSTITYLEGATFQAVTGVVSQDTNINPNDDGNGSSGETISTDQVTVLLDKIEEVKASKAVFLRWLKVESLDELRASSFDRAMKQLDVIGKAKK